MLNRMKWFSKKYGLQTLVVIEFVIIVIIVKYYVRDVDLSIHVKAGSREFGRVSPRRLTDSSLQRTTESGMKTSMQDLNSSLAELKETHIPRIVYQILNDNVFTFRNYLSIISVFKILKPFRIILYVPNEFNPKPLEYNMWFQKAADIIPYLEVRKYSDEAFILNDKIALQHIVVMTELSETGGIYVNLNTIINKDLWKDTKRNIRIGIAGNSSIGFVQMAQNFHVTDLVHKNALFGELLRKSITTDCVFPNVFKDGDKCCIIPNIIYPMNIMRNKSEFASFARYLFYGTSQISTPQQSFPPIPKVVHYVWFGNETMTYSMYISFLSTLRFVNPLQIIIYVETYDLGPYFDAMKNSSVVSVINYGRPRFVFQRPINKFPHLSDYVRADVLLRLGGIYLDWDVFWLKPIDDLLTLGYETIAAKDPVIDILDRQDFPDLINMGVLLARPGSRFITLWMDSFHKYIGDHYTFHAVEMVYKLYEEHPDLLYLEDTLQVLCFPYKTCHPLWLPDYQKYNVHHEFNFTKDAYSVHITGTLPNAFKSEAGIRVSEGFFADMARHVHGALY